MKFQQGLKPISTIRTKCYKKYITLVTRQNFVNVSLDWVDLKISERLFCFLRVMLLWCMFRTLIIIYCSPTAAVLYIYSNTRQRHLSEQFGVFSRNTASPPPLSSVYKRIPFRKRAWKLWDRIPGKTNKTLCKMWWWGLNLNTSRDI